MTNFQPGDRVKVYNSEFPTWIPTNATVTKRYIKFARAKPSMQRQMIEVWLDEHPFKEQLFFEPMQILGWEIGDPNFRLEKL